MIKRKSGALVQYRETLLGAGQLTFTKDKALKDLGLTASAFLSAAERLQKKHHLARPKQGFYVVVPPEYVSWQAPPPDCYIDPLMAHLNADYYVGILTAAAWHGSAHHAVMRFQVVTDRYLPSIRVGRSDIDFHYRKDMASVSAGTTKRWASKGVHAWKVSSPELTAIDLLRYPRAAAGLDNIATVLGGLFDEINAVKLAKLAWSQEKRAMQRLGYLLDWFGHGKLTGPMRENLFDRGSVAWTELERKYARQARPLPAPKEQNRRWRVIVRRYPDPE